MRCRSGGAELVVFGFLGHLFFGIAFIGSHSSVSRSSSSSNYISSPPSVFSVLAFLFLLWLGSATDHSAQTQSSVIVILII